LLDKISSSERRGIAAAFATACLALSAWAFPNMTRFATIPGAVLTAVLAVWFLWPEIKSASAKLVPQWQRLGGFLIIVAALSASLWYAASITPPPTTGSIPRMIRLTAPLKAFPDSHFWKGPWQSTLGKALLYCDIPPPETKDSDQARVMAEFLKQFNVTKARTEGWGQALGLDIQTNLITDGIRMEVEAKTNEGKQRMWTLSGTTVTKFTLEIRRVGPVEIVSFIVDYPNVPKDSPMLLMPLTGTKEQEEEFTANIENVLGAPRGSCHLF